MYFKCWVEVRNPANYRPGKKRDRDSAADIGTVNRTGPHDRAARENPRNAINRSVNDVIGRYGRAREDSHGKRTNERAGFTARPINAEILCLAVKIMTVEVAPMILTARFFLLPRNSCRDPPRSSAIAGRCRSRYLYCRLLMRMCVCVCVFMRRYNLIKREIKILYCPEAFGNSNSLII